VKNFLPATLAALALLAIAPDSSAQVRDDTTWIGGGTAFNVDVGYVNGPNGPQLMLQGNSASGMTNATTGTAAPGSTPGNPAADSSGVMYDPDAGGPEAPPSENVGHAFRAIENQNGDGIVAVWGPEGWIPMRRKAQQRDAYVGWGGSHKDSSWLPNEEVTSLPVRPADVWVDRFTVATPETAGTPPPPSSVSVGAR
jgi:hypothetical protein